MSVESPSCEAVNECIQLASPHSRIIPGTEVGLLPRKVDQSPIPAYCRRVGESEVRLKLK